ncbi:MAG TPA: hypothetical protein VHD15_08445 [Hyphomicrobiales bacterium]|nr:hypothetical protein [Hyphomicrobiales bacterium]
MARNRFEQVDEPQADALNLVLAREDADKAVGRVLCPSSAAPQGLPRNYDSGALPAVEAFRSAISLANTLKVAIVVIDPDGVWHQEWGDLFRDEGEAGEA